MKKLFTLIFMIVVTTTFAQKATNYWDGSFNSYWHNNSNWSLGHIPTSTEDVVIPNGMPRYPSVDIYDEQINSLTIQSSAEVRIYDQTLEVIGDIYVYGEILMNDTDARLYCDNITWYSGSEAQTTGNCRIILYGTWEFVAGANVQLDYGVVEFHGTDSQYIRSKDADCYFNNVYPVKTGGLFGLSSQSTATCKIKGHFILGGSNYDFTSPSVQTIQIGDYLNNGNPTIDIILANGTIEFTGNTGNCAFFPQPGDYFNNLTINTGSYDLDMNTYYSSIFEIKGDVTINSGRLDVNDMDLIVGGDWDNNAGSVGFWERDRKVTFNGSGHQYCSDEYFYALEIDKSGGALRINGTAVECYQYDWTAGALDVLSGSFTANDLVDNAIQGSYYLNSGGVINLHNEGGYIDLKGDLFIYGGEFNVYGGTIASYWPYGEDASITMEDGILDFKDQGIKIYNTGYALNDNITGGRIKCAGYLHLERSDFTPNAGIFEMYGSTDADIKTINGSRFWDLAIDKVDGGKSSGVKPFTDRDGTYFDGSKGNTANAISNIACYEHLYIDGGTLNMNTYDFTTNGSAVIYGTLEMNSADNDFTVGWDVHWMPGSSDNVSAGNFWVGRHWYFESGTSAQLGTGNTVHFVNNGTQIITTNDGDAEFGNVSIENTALAVWTGNTSASEMRVAGNFTVVDNGKFVLQDNDVVVDGILDIQPGGYIRTDHPEDQLTVNSNFTLNGELEVGDGSVMVHGTFDIAATGELTIATGSFTYDEGIGECQIYGTINLSDGTLTTNEAIVVKSGAVMNVSGGIIRSHALIADYANTFQPSGGIFELSSESTGFGSIRLDATNYFHNLKINSTTTYSGGILASDILINNDFIVSSGALSINGFIATVGNDAEIFGHLVMDDPDDILIVGNDIFWKPGSTANYITYGQIQVYGNWTFENGTNAQLGANNVVKFIGAGATSIYNYDEDAGFGRIWGYKSPGSNIYINGASTYPVKCAGGFSVENGCQFHIQHESLLVDGGFYVGSNSLVDMLGYGSVDAGGDLNIWGTLDVGDGEMTHGGNFYLQSTGILSINDGSLVCNNPCNGANEQLRGTLNLTGTGLLEFAHNSLQVYSTAVCIISGGTIRVGHHFFASQPGTFHPVGGTVEMSDGYAGGQIFCTGDNYFYNLDINDNILAGDDFTVDNDMNINTGTFNVNGKTVEVGHDINIYNTLQMTDASSELKCEHYLSWKTGSADQVTTGAIYTAQWIFEDGTNASIETGNTAYVEDGIGNYDPDAEFGNLIIGEWAKSAAFGNQPDDETETNEYLADGRISEYTSDEPKEEKSIDNSRAYARRVAGNCTYLPGVAWGSTVDIIIQGTLDIQDGASQTLNSDNTISTYSNFTLNGTLDLGYAGNGYVDGEFEIASTGELIIGGGEFVVENSSASYNHVYGTMVMTDGLFRIDHNIKFEPSANADISGGMIRTGGFYAQLPGAFEPTGGTVEIQSPSGGQGGLDCSNGNFLYNLSINAINAGGGAHLNNDLLITNDLEALTGNLDLDGFSATVQGNATFMNGGLKMENGTDVFNAGDDPADELLWTSDASFEWNNSGTVNIFGNCTVESGVAYDVDADQTFAFVGTGDQEFNNFDDATFGTIELAKPSGALIIPSGSAVGCQSYDWTAGTLTVQGGALAANDLADNIVEGTINLHGGLLDFTQDLGQNLSVEGHLNITDGTFNLRGGAWECNLALTDALFLTMSGGVLDFINNGVDISSGLLVMNMTGGTIRTNRYFTNINPGFLPGGGMVEMYGGNVNLSSSAGYFHDIKFDGGNIFLQSDLMVQGDLMVNDGYLIGHAREITCMGDVEINQYGTLQIWEGSTIRLDNNSSFNVHWNGHFDSYGSTDEMNLITGESTGDYYSFTVESGGFINPRNTIFEKMTSHGVNILEGALVSVQRFNNCIFRNGWEGGTLLTMNTDDTFEINGAVFETSAKGPVYNVTKTNDAGDITFVDFSGNFSGEAWENDPNNRIHWFVPQLTVTPMNQDVGAPAGITTFEVISNIDWTVTEAFDWIEVSPASGSGNETLTVNYEENTSLIPRVASFTVTGDGVPDVVLTVTQAGADPVLVVTPSNRNVGIAAGTTSFSIISNTSWDVSESAAWLSVDPLSGSGNATLEVTFQQNNNGSVRVGEITISTTGKLAVVVTVTQEGQTPELSVDPGSFDFLAPNGINFLNVYSNTTWVITDDMDWLGLNLDTPAGNQVVQVSVVMNNTGVVRTGEITVETEDGSIEIIVPVTQQPFVEHVISLPAGWSGLSSYALPSPPFIEDVFAGIMDGLVITLTEDGIFYPEYGVNTIGMWEPFSAYKIKTDAAVELEIYGSAYPTTTLTIPAGWSMLPVISECDVDVEVLFGSVITNIIMVKDIAGYGVFWPEMNINTIGALHPGRAYYVMAQNPVEITFAPCTKTTTGIPDIVSDLNGSIWPEPEKTPLTHNIAISGSTVEPGMIIGAFDSEGNCFGQANSQSGATSLTLFGDDKTTAGKDGFLAGERVYFRLLNPATAEILNISPEYDYTFPDAEGTFRENGLSVISGFKLLSAGSGNDLTTGHRIYPNPCNGVFTIEGFMPGAEITISDARGRIVFENESTKESFSNINLEHRNPGVYLVRIRQHNSFSFHKLIIQ